MSRIFLSHSSKDNNSAVAIRDWLTAQGWDDVFLDLDPQRGIAAGDKWERSLNQAALRCEAVLFLVSRAWLSSDWCLKEFNLAHRLNKRLFGLLIEDIPIGELPATLTGTWQMVPLASGRDHIMLRAVLPGSHDETHVTFSQEGLTRLRIGLERAGLDAKFFTWPPRDDPRRPPYRGLLPLEAGDTGIFFGREAPTIEALDRIRGMRDGAAPRLLVLLGASGAGKSSFLRAGLLPRLARDDRAYLPLPVVRPEHAAINGEAGLLRSLEAAFAAQNASISRAEIRAGIEGGAETLRPLLKSLIERAQRSLVTEGVDAKAPVLVLAIDQGEELFLTDGATESAVLLNLLRELLTDDAPALLSVVTIRSDAYEQLQTAKALEGVVPQILSLAPMPRGAYQSVIEGPAARLKETDRPLLIQPALTQALLSDIEDGGGRDALPLLAFSLERLYLEYGARGSLKLEDYDALGRIKGSIEAAVGRAFAAADNDPRIPRDKDARLALLRRGLIPWLAGIDPDTGSPRRVKAQISEIPPEARPLIDLLVEQRLLSTDVSNETGERTIEPAHEALLRQWGSLQGWLQEDFAVLTSLETVKRAARDWAANARSDDWLSHRAGRLEDAERLLQRHDLAAKLDTTDRDYLVACRQREEAERREKTAALERRVKVQRRFIIAALAATIVMATFGGLAYWQKTIADDEKTQAERATVLAHANLVKADEQTAIAKDALGRAEDEKLKASKAAISALLSESDRTLQSKPRLALATALRAVDLRLSRQGPFDPEILTTLQRAINATDDYAAKPSLWTFAAASSAGYLIFQDTKWRLQPHDSAKPVNGEATSPIKSASVSDDVVAAGTADGSVSIWNAKDGALLKSSPLEEGAIADVLLVAERLVVLTAANRLHVLSLPGLSEAAPTRSADRLLAVDRFGRYALAGQRGATMVLNLQDNKLDRVLTSVTKPFKQVSISPDGRLVAGLSADGSFVLFDPVNDVKMLNLSKAINSRSSVISIAFVDDQRLELLHEDGSAGEIQLDGEPLPIWRDTLLRGAVALAPLRGDISTAVAVRLDGDRIVTNGLDWLSMANFACDIGGWQSSTTGTEAESTALNICEDRIKPASAVFSRTARTAAPAADLLAQFADFQGAAAVLGNAESLKVFPATLPPDAAPDAARGYRLEFGPPAERNRQEALKAYRAAALANDPFALSRLAILLIDNDDPSLAAEAHQALARAVQLNFPLAVDVQAQAAELGEPENDQRARDLFKKAIDLGERSRSPRNLATLLQQSAKSPEDWDEVARYFRIAVQAGDGRAADDLAKLIETGSIQPKDGAELPSLLKLASEYSAHGALRYALELDRQARSDPATAALADKYRWSAAKAGDGDGLFQVGHKMAQSSKPEDRHIAAALFVNSRRAGHLAAASALADLLADEGAGNAEVRHWFRIGRNPDSSSMMTVPERQISPSELVANTTKMAAISSSDIRYGFDRDGHQISVRSPNGTAELRWDQKLGTVAAVSVELQKGTHAEYSYVKNDLGALTSVRKAGEDILHLEYDKDGRLTRIAETGEAGNRLRLTYSKEAEQTWISMEAVSEYSLRCRFDNYASFIGAQNVSYFQFSDCGSLHDTRNDAIAKSVDALIDIIEPQRQIDPNAQLLSDPGKLLFSIRRFIRTNG